jgi:hypothetical protein
VPKNIRGVYSAMSLFSPHTLPLTLKPLVLIDLVQVLSFGRHSSQKIPSLGP